MKKFYCINMSGGRYFQIPLTDPIVAKHFSTDSSYVSTLLDQINDGLYDKLFQGKKNVTFLDIGANAGLVSIYVADLCERIVAVEPSPEVFPVLQAMTKYFPNIEPVCAALAPVDKEVEFYLNDINSTASSTVNTYGTPTTVPGKTLGTILIENGLTHVDICKCDCEAAEGRSLTYEQLLLAKPIIQSWFIETHNCPEDTWQDKMGRLVRDLCRVGYDELTISGMTLTAKQSCHSLTTFHGKTCALTDVRTTSEMNFVEEPESIGNDPASDVRPNH